MSGDESGEADQNVVIRTLQLITPTFIRKSFAIKFGLVLAIMAVSIGGIGIAATDTIQQQTENRAEERFERSASQQADIAETWLEKRQLRTRLQAGTEWPTQSRGGNIVKLSKVAENDDIHQAHLINLTDGRAFVVNSTDSDLATGDRLSPGPRDWFETNSTQISRTSSGDVYISDTYKVDNQEVIGFVAPTNVGDKVQYLYVEATIFSLRTDLQSSGPQETEIVNANNNLVMLGSSTNRTLDIYAESQAALEPVRKASELRDSENTSAGVISRIEGNPNTINEPYVAGYAPIQTTGVNWVVVVQSPRSAEFGFVQTVDRLGTFVTALAVLLIGITGTALGYTTSTAIDRLTAKTDEMREGDLDVSFATSRIDNIGRLYDGFAEMRDALQEQIEEAERARKEAEVSRAEALEMSNYLEEKAEEYSDIMQQCAAGDLTQRMSQDGENESMDTIAAEFNEMIEELEKTTEQLKSYVDEVEEAGEEVEQSANTVREASEQVADSIQKIAVDAEDQKERLQSISETMDEIADELDTFAAEHPEADIEGQLERIQSIAGDINEIADLSEETQAETDNVSAAAQEQAAELNEVSERANDLQRYAQPLRDILDRFETEAEHEFVFSVGPTGSGNPSNED